MQARRHDHDHRDEKHDSDRRGVSGVEHAADGLRRDERGALSLGFRDTERGRHLLQEDDHGDPDRESLDHRPRHVREIAAESRERRDHDQCPGHDPHEEHGVAAVASHDRNQHDRHRARRPRNLHVRPAEHGRDQSRNDRSHQAGTSTQAGRDSERQRERQGDDPNGDSGDQIVAPRPRQLLIVRAAREQAPERRDSCVHASPAATRSSASRPWDSASELISMRLAEASSATNSGSRIA